MKIRLSLVLAAALATCSSFAELKISVFANLLDKIAREEKVSVAQAADLLKAAGVAGFDSDYRNKRLPELVQTSLRPINLYGFLHFLGPDNGAAEIVEFVDTAVRHGVPRIMVVPDAFTPNGDREAEYARIRDGLKALVAAASAKGVTVTVEDFGGVLQNPCSDARYLKRFLTDVPGLCFALDSGNLYFAGRGDDILEMMRFAKDRIRHVHLKDQTKEDNHKYASLGIGAVPNKEVVEFVRAMGYDGWYTLENLVSDPDALTDVHRQIAVLRHWCR